MNRFQHANAQSIKEALSFVGEKWDGTRIIAGGTDLLGEIKNGIISPKAVINIKTIRDLDFIKYSNGKGLRIGALTRIADIEDNTIIKET